MKKRYYLYSIVACYFIFLVTTLPAVTVAKIVNDNSQLSLRGVSGTFWQGSATELKLTDEISLNDTHWDFNLWKLFIGQVSANVNTYYIGNVINAEAGTTFLGTYFTNNLKTSIPASVLTQLTAIPFVQLEGLIAFDIAHAEWRNNTAPIASGTILWTEAAIIVADTASLGNVTITLGESNQQFLVADITNQGGDIKISGGAQLLSDSDYAVDIKLLPTPSANANIKQSLGLFAKEQTGGEYVFIKKGSLNQIGFI